MNDKLEVYKYNCTSSVHDRVMIWLQQDIVHFFWYSFHIIQDSTLGVHHLIYCTDDLSDTLSSSMLLDKESSQQCCGSGIRCLFDP
jgi:hypothetical protein